MLDETTLMIFAVVTEWIVADAILVLVAYRALELRAVLRNKASRRQALWLGVVCLYLLPILPLPFPNPSLLYDVVFGIYFSAGLPIVLLAWVDGAVLAARRSDPLYRDPLAWTKIRIIIWAVTLAAIALNSGLFTLEPLTGVIVSVPAILSVVLAFVPLVPPFLAGTSVLLLVARRTRSVIRHTNVKWFALFYLFQLATTLASIVTTTGVSDSQLVCGCILYFLAFHGIYAIGWNVVDILAIISVYCLYQYVRSLAQLNRLPLRDEAYRLEVETSE